MTRPPDVLHAPGIFELLIPLAHSGSSHALGQMFEPYIPMLANLAHSLLNRQLRSKMDSLDLVQEVFLQVEKGLGGFNGGSAGAWEAWLKQILAHQARNVNKWYRQTAKRHLGREVGLLGNIGLFLRMPEDAKSAAQRDDASDQLNTILGRLPIEYHFLIVFHCLTGYSLEIIAKATKQSIGSVRKQHGRALERARREAQVL